MSKSQPTLTKKPQITEPLLQEPQKSITQEDLKQYFPVFRLKPLSGIDRTMIRYMGIIKNDQELKDEPLDLDDQNNNTLYICNIGEYELSGRIFWCNIMGDYLIKNKKIPVCYLSISYERKFVSGTLCAYFLYFTIDDASLKELTSPQKYLNYVASGTYHYELVTDEGLLGKLLNEKTSYFEEQIIQQNMHEFSEETQYEFFAKINSLVDQKISNLRDIFTQKPTTCVTKKKIVKHLLEIKLNNEFIDVLSYALQLREQERMEKMGNNIENKIPKRIINLKQVQDDPASLDKLLDNLSDEDSEEDDF